MVNPTFIGWFYIKNGQKFGPISTEEIEKLLGDGTVRPWEKVWTEWRDRDEIKVLEDHKQHLRVLVADDNKDSADTTAVLLRMWGHTVETVYDGESAFRTALAFNPNVMLIDVAMPRMDGCRLAQQVRQESSVKKALLVAVTGYGDEAHQKLFIQAGFDHCFTKPVDIPALHALLMMPKTE
jgi:CheY-like chemotaxis protein